MHGTYTTLERVLLVVVDLLLGAVFGQIAGILTVVSGGSIPLAFGAGGATFVATVTLAVLVQNQI